ncbi:MAG: sigma-70 family RNA polymerase sigma factor [Syntrophomonadaceae bacterium]|jgi:RNA polymerase sigma factor for flagellar operon FliA
MTVNYDPEQYMDLVKQIVDRIDVKLPPHWDREDMLSYGFIGLMEAINRYQPDKGVKFSTYASIRIKGAIIDALRKHAPLPRNRWQLVKQINEAAEKLTSLNGKEPSLEEIALELNITRTEVEDTLEAVKMFSHISLEQTLNLGGNAGLKVEDKIAADQETNLEDLVVKKEEIELLAKAITKLDKRQQLVLMLYYYEELTMKEIAAILDIGVPRVSQIKTMALLALRKHLDT